MYGIERRNLKNIKFRGRTIGSCDADVHVGDWVYGSLIVTDEGNSFITTWKKGDGTHYDIKTYQVDPKTVGQYTGLHDNKKTEEYPQGQEVYEGDYFYYHRTLRKVVYREDNTTWMGVVVKGHIGSCNIYLRDITMYDRVLNAEIAKVSILAANEEIADFLKSRGEYDVITIGKESAKRGEK